MIFPVLLVKVVHSKPQTIKQISSCTANMLDQQYYHDKRLYCGCKFFTMTTFYKEDGKVPDEGNKEKGKGREHLKTLRISICQVDL